METFFSLETMLDALFWAIFFHILERISESLDA